MKKSKAKIDVSKFLDRALDKVKPARKWILVSCGMYAKPHPKTFTCLLNTIGHFYRLDMGIELIVSTKSASVAALYRKMTLQAFMDKDDKEGGGLGVVFIDDDMVWPVMDDFDPIARFLQREKDIVTTLCTTRRMPISVALGREDPTTGIGVPFEKWPDCMEIADPNTATPFKTDFSGFGMVWLSRNVIRGMHDWMGGNPGWFHDEALWEKFPGIESAIAQHAIDGDHAALKKAITLAVRGSYHYVEDYAFCRKARAAGFDIWCDPSFLVSHVGDYEYNVFNWLAQEREKRGTLMEALTNA